MNRKERRFAAKQSKTVGGGTRVATDTAELAAQANTHLQAGRLAEAEALYRQVLAVHPTHVDSLHLLGGVAHQTGRHELAAELIGKAIAINGRIAIFHSNLAGILRTLGRLEEAIAACRRAVALQPDLAPAYVNLGIMQASLGRLDEAVQSYQKAIALKHDSAELHNSIGNALHEIGKFEEAAAAFRRAIARQPGGADAHNNLGNALQASGHYDEAIAAYQRAVELRPNFGEAYYHLGNVQREQGKFLEAMVAYGKALALAAKDDSSGELQQHHAAALAQLAFVRAQICDWSEIEQDDERVRQALHAHVQAATPFGLLCRPSTAAEQLLCAQRWVEGWGVDATAEFSHRPPAAPRKIRLGYFSADFRDHPVGNLIPELIARHDRSQFDVIAYAYGPDESSETRERLTTAFDRFIDVQPLTDLEAAQKIHADGIDILVDLTCHTAHTRSPVLAFRPAPIQVNFLGYTGTAGTSCYDYAITDAFVVPSDQQPFFTEKLVHLPHCYMPSDTSRVIAERVPSRAEYGLPAEGFVFCSFNNSYKINPTMFDIWMRLLARRPDSVLWLLEPNEQAMINLRREAVARGMAAERLVFSRRVALPDHLARHSLADLFLDTLPFNAHATANAALWAGLPVLTCPGTTFASRVAGSLLQAIGLPELITATLQDYEATALHLAEEPGELAELRRRLERNRTTAPLFDMARYTRDLDAAYEAMWERWRATPG